jgi:hypothetical protein
LILGVENDEYLFKEINYLIENTKYAKTIVVSESNKDELNKFFNFAMLVDMEVKLKERVERKLFD